MAENYYMQFTKAIENNNEPQVKTLLKSYGAKEKRDDVINDIVHVAIEYGCSEIVTIFLNHSNASRYGNSILFTAIEAGNLKVVMLVLDSGVDVNVGDGLALRMAALYFRKDIVKVLLERGAKTDASCIMDMMDCIEYFSKTRILNGKRVEEEEFLSVMEVCLDTLVLLLDHGIKSSRLTNERILKIAIKYNRRDLKALVDPAS